MAFKVADEKFFAADGYVARLSHVVAAVEPADQLARLGDDEHRRGNRVDGDDIARGSDRQTRHDVDIPDRDLPDEMTWAGETKMSMRDMSETQFQTNSAGDLCYNDPSHIW